MHRLFVAIRPPQEIRDLLIDAMDESASFHWQNDEQLHLTLRFIGDVERPIANDIADELGKVRCERFAVRISGVGCFEKRLSGALWAAIDPKAPVTALAAKVERACQSTGLEPERRAFHPHITIARWRSRKGSDVQDFLERRRDLASVPFKVTQFILFESRLSRHGAHYEQIAHYPLI